MTVGGIVLCGGKSTRMGTPKAALPFGDETMLQRVVRLLGTVVSPIVVVAARDQSLPRLPDAALVTRDEREAKGPLEGIRAGLSALPDSTDAAYITISPMHLRESFWTKIARPVRGIMYHGWQALVPTDI